MKAVWTWMVLTTLAIWLSGCSEPDYPCLSACSSRYQTCVTDAASAADLRACDEALARCAQRCRR
jgi:hypothetical protein